MDNPLLVEQMQENMSDQERKAFDIGYAAALMGVVEQYTESKQKILAKCLDIEDEDHKRQLLSRVHILDVYEKHYRKRLKVLERQAEPA